MSIKKGRITKKVRSLKKKRDKRLINIKRSDAIANKERHRGYRVSCF